MAELVTITVDGIKVEVPKGMMAVDAAKRIEVDIPVFCYHPKLPAVGMCRMCLVEIGTPKLDPATKQPVLDDKGEVLIGWMPKLQTACTTPVSPGMAIRTTTDQVKVAQKDIIEFILTSHPLDCPICQKGGECPLQNLTIRHGPGVSRFPFDEKLRLDKRKPLGDLIYLDEERCIQCARCIRFQDELAEDHVLAFTQRGRSLQIITSSVPGFDSVFSGNTTDICPVGALLSADYYHSPRPWEIRAVPSICPHCPVGCNLALNTRVNHKYLVRVMPRQNEQVNEIWICDKGRWGYHYVSSPERLATPQIRKGTALVEASWDEALALVAQRLKIAGAQAGGIAGDRLSNEDLYEFQRMLRDGVKTANVDQWPNRLGGGELVAQVGLARGSNMSDWGPETAILVIASDLENEAPIYWLRVNAAAKRGARLVVASGRPTKSDHHAAYLLRYRYGSEVAALNSLLAAVLDLGLENREFAARVDGLDALRARLAEVYPQPAGSAPANPSDGVAQRMRRFGEFFAPVGTPSGKPDQERVAANLAEAAKLLAEAQNLVVIYGGEGLSYAGSQALARAAANLLIVTGHAGRPNNGLMAVWPHNNTQGAWDMGVRPDLLPGYQPVATAGLDAAGMLAGGVRALFVAGADPAGEDPATVEALRKLDFLVVSELFMTETAKLAHVLLPATAFAEREGSYTNGERRVQRFYLAVPPRGTSRPDWRIFAEIGTQLGLPSPAASAAVVMQRISEGVPPYAGMSYTQLAHTEPQYPDVGGRDLYYGGTAYQNTGGLGVVWPAQAEEAGARLAVEYVEAPELAGLGAPHDVTEPSGAEATSEPGAGETGASPAPLRAVPITLLYDDGTMLQASSEKLLAAHIPTAYVELHAADAARLGVADGEAVALQLGGRALRLQAHVNGSTPEGVVLVPRDLVGSPALPGPAAATLRKVGA